jgi:hypothetical protein
MPWVDIVVSYNEGQTQNADQHGPQHAQQHPTRHPRDTQEHAIRSLVAYAIVCLVVVIVVTSLRFYVRFRLLRKFGIDDIALAVTLVRAPVVLPR